MNELEYPAWRQRLVRSLHLNRSQIPSKYYQVASVSADGRPRNRSMVFRGFLSGTHCLLSVTDHRSNKVNEWQLDNNSFFELCWYFSGSREQYRLAGELVLLSKSISRFDDHPVLAGKNKQSVLKQQWSNLSTNAQQAFFLESPKAPFDEKAQALLIQCTQGCLSAQGCQTAQGSDNNNESENNNKAKIKAADKKFEISDNFCVVVFIPHSVDYLNLKRKPQQRCLYDIQNHWREVSVNP